MRSLFLFTLRLDMEVMMFNKSYENLMGEYLSYAPGDIDTREGSVFYDAGAGFLFLLAKFYADGWLDNEYYVKEYDKAKEIVVAGHCGVVIGHQWASLINLDQNHENEPEAEWRVFPQPSATGAPVKYRRTLGMYGCVCINKDCKNPEAIIKINNLYNEKLYGPNSQPDIYFAPTINGVSCDIWSLSPFGCMYERCDIDTNIAIVPAFKGEMDPNELTGMEKVYYDNSMENWGWMRMFAPEESPGAEWIKAANDPATYIQANLFSGAPGPVYTEKWTQLEDLRDTTLVQIITGRVDPEQGYYEMIDNWKKMGGDDITKEVNEWWAGQK